MMRRERFCPRVISTGGPARPGRNGEISRGRRDALGLWPGPSTALRSAQDDRAGEGSAHRDRASGGFTLVELLVVVSIITMLMAMLLPVVHRARKQAQAVACMAQLRQCGVLFCTQAEEYDNRRIEPKEVWSLLGEAGGAKADEPVSCLAAPPLPATNDPVGPASVSGGDFWVSNGSYGFNAYLEWGQYNRIGRPGSIPLVFDAVRRKVMPRHTDEPPGYEGDCWMTRGNHQAMRFVCIGRHQGTVNMLFLDWSAREVGLKELWTLKWSDDFETAGPWTRAGGVLPEDWPHWLRKFKDY